MKKFYHILIIIFFLTSYNITSLADNPVDYISFEMGEGAISVDSFGATSVQDKSFTFKLFATTGINNNLAVEYGFMNSGIYKADYNITAGTFQFIESHTVDFSKSLFSSVKIGTTLSGLADYMGRETPHNESIYPPDKEVYFFTRLGILLWHANLDMDGYMYDTGTPFGPYGATSDSYGFSSFYGFGAEYTFFSNFIISLDWEIYSKVGDGAKLKFLDGTTEKYPGRYIESIGIGITYIFQP